MRPTKSSSWFTKVAKATSRAAGRPAAFVFAGAVILAWAATAHRTAIPRAVQIKLDELIRTTEGAHNALLDLEELEEDECDQIRQTYAKLAKAARADLRRGIRDTGRPDVKAD